MSPPRILDEVWHKHIDSQEGDWAVYCRTVIGKPIEHRTGLSPSEAQAARSRVNELYEREFGAPHRDIWPGPAEKRRHALAGAIIICGVLLAFGGHLTMAAVILLGFQPTVFWIPYTFFGGIGITVLGFLIGLGTQVPRTSNCG